MVSDDVQYKSATQEEPQTPKGAFETKQNEPADFFVAVQGSDTTMLNRNPDACNKKIAMFISRMFNTYSKPGHIKAAHKMTKNLFLRETN